MTNPAESKSQKPDSESRPANLVYKRLPQPLPNYTLSTVCPACDTPTYRLACKVRCPRCGFMWDCSEL